MGSLWRRLLDTTDPTASLRHAAYGVGVLSSVCWLSYALHRPGLNGDWVIAFGLFLTAVVTGKVIKPVGVEAPTSQPAVVSPGSGLGSTSEGGKDGL